MFQVPGGLSASAAPAPAPAEPANTAAASPTMNSRFLMVLPLPSRCSGVMQWWRWCGGLGWWSGTDGLLEHAAGGGDAAVELQPALVEHVSPVGAFVEGLGELVDDD